MVYVRWFGVIFGGASLAMQDDYPDIATRNASWTLVIVLALGNLVVWGFLARIREERDQDQLGRVVFALDTLVISGFVWVFAYEDPYVTWALLFVIPLEGALRFRLRGALLSVAYVALFFIPQSIRFADLHDTVFDPSTYIFMTGLAGLIGGVAGTMAENWHEKSMAFEKQSARLAELDRLKDRYVAMTSHEIRGPLTAIITGVDTIRRRADRLTAEQHDRLLDMVQSQGHQLARLVDDLMLSSELQAGTLALQLEWIDVEEAVGQALEAAAGKRGTHQLEVYIEPLRAEIDQSRFSQITRNLVENAYKYTPDRTRVSVTVKATSEGIMLEVADDGPGIPPQKRDQLFDAFSRIEETAAGQEGVGLGLYVVSQIVAAMKGRIDLSSSSRGTIFTIHIPCKKMAEERPRIGLVRAEDAG